MNTKSKEDTRDHASTELDPPLMTVAEVARHLGMSTAWVRKHAAGVRKPVLPSVKLGKSVRFRRATVLAFIQEQERAELLNSVDHNLTAGGRVPFRRL
jgi:excisionase family DNA binding protein